MYRHLTIATLLPIAAALTLQPAVAQVAKRDGSKIGEVITTSDAASVAKSMEPRREGHFWYHSRCWDRRADGSYVSVPTRYCTAVDH